MIEQVFTGSEVIFQVLRFFLTFALGVMLTRTVLMPATGKLMTRRGSTKKAFQSIENIIGLTGFFTTLLVALQIASFGNLLTVLGALAAAATVAIGFGMRDQVSSVVAGIFIHTDNPFLKGDYIKVDETEGRVKEINLRATKLNSENDEKIVPNNILTTNTVQNFTRGNRTSDSVKVKVPIEKAEEAAEILLEAVQENEEVFENPEPKLRYTSIEETDAEIRTDYWMKESADIRGIRSQIIESYTERAREKGIYEKDAEDKSSP